MHVHVHDDDFHLNKYLKQHFFQKVGCTFSRQHKNLWRTKISLTFIISTFGWDHDCEHEYMLDLFPFPKNTFILQYSSKACLRELFECRLPSRSSNFTKKCMFKYYISSTCQQSAGQDTGDSDLPRVSHVIWPSPCHYLSPGHGAYDLILQWDAARHI